MGNAQKMMVAVVGVFAIGFLMVGSNKEQSDEQRKSSAMVRDVANLQYKAKLRCPKLVRKHAPGSKLLSLNTSDTDHSTYYTLKWIGESDDNFKTASCKVGFTDNGATVIGLIIDEKVIIDKN